MAWFAAHAVMVFQHTDGPQDGFFVWENVLLVEAADPSEALIEAARRARRDEGDDDGSLRMDDRPVALVFGGIRKLISVDHERTDDRLSGGDEITYSKFHVADREALDRLIEGRDVTLSYIE